ncbi:MAG: rhodanese-like domain-containing protein [Spirosoma sp.]|nr:rhodanese-like domain-containing protein [Spirosoma sp.]
MMELIKKLLGGGRPNPIAELMTQGVTIIDVRSKGEFQGGHLKKAINAPLDTLPGSLPKLDKSKPVVVCCASGMRSASAKHILESAGFANVHNGGGWAGLRKYES